MNASLHRAVWRWHFYAGLITLPVLVWLAVTGALYLYKPEIERAIYGDWIVLAAPAAPMPARAMIGRIEQATGGRVTQLIRPEAADESWRATVEGADGALRTAFVHPADGALLGTTSEGGVMETVRVLHSLAITGPVGNVLIEIVAGWAIILAVTGFVLWWPRGGRGALGLRGRPGERRFWRDLHASAGALVGTVILFLAVTGMPWSIVWGEQLQQLVAANQWGRPPAPGAQPKGTKHNHVGEEAQRQDLPWALQAASPPHPHGTGDVGPDRALASAEARGLRAPYVLNLPLRPGAPYAISRTAERASEARVIYVEPAGGRVLQDVSHADFGPGAQTIEWGIHTHQGQTYGEPNRLLMLAGCIGIALLAGSAPVLWWKRRRSGALQAPPRAADPARTRGLIAAMAVLGIIYPLTGATMVVAAAADRLLRGRRGGLSSA